MKSLKRFVNEAISGEKCWSIKERQPIPVKVLSNHNIEVGPMLMRYETWQKLGDNLDADVIKMRLDRQASYGLGDLTDRMIKYPTGVNASSYKYADGSCSFTSPSKQDTENWLKQYEGIVKKI